MDSFCQKAHSRVNPLWSLSKPTKESIPQGLNSKIRLLEVGAMETKLVI